MRTPFERLQDLYLRIFDSEFLRRILRNSSYLVSATVISAGLGMVQGIFQYRVLDLAGVGLLAAVGGFTSVLNRFTSFRIDELVVRYVRLYQERGQLDRASAVYKFAGILELLGSLAAFLLIVVLAPLGVSLFSDQAGTEQWFILYGALVLINFVFHSSDGILKVFNRFDAKSLIDISQSIVRLLLTLLVFATGGGLFEIILAELAGRLVRSIAVIGLAFRTAKQKWGQDWWRTPISVLGEDRRSLLTFAFSTNLSATVSLVAKDSEDLWVNAILGNLAGGIYGLARTLNGLLQIPVSPLPSTTYPELSTAVAQNDWKSVNGILKRGSLLAALYSLPTTALLIVFGHQLIGLYSSNPDASQAYLPLVILLLGFSFVNVFYWNRAALLAFNRPVYPTIVNLIGMILKVLGIIFLAETYGVIAFAALLVGYYIFTVGLSVLRVRKDLRYHLSLAENRP
jgi:O-antigen/teichoic acid export membrane protein